MTDFEQKILSELADLRKTEESTKQYHLEAFDKSKTKSISDVCRITGFTRGTYYFHFYKDAEFRKQVFIKQQEKLTSAIAAI